MRSTRLDAFLVLASKLVKFLFKCLHKTFDFLTSILIEEVGFGHETNTRISGRVDEVRLALLLYELAPGRKELVSGVQQVSMAGRGSSISTRGVHSLVDC